MCLSGVGCCACWLTSLCGGLAVLPQLLLVVDLLTGGVLDGITGLDGLDTSQVIQQHSVEPLAGPKVICGAERQLRAVTVGSAGNVDADRDTVSDSGSHTASTSHADDSGWAASKTCEADMQSVRPFSALWWPQ